jgi:hypothetical protein
MNPETLELIRQLALVLAVPLGADFTGQATAVLHFHEGTCSKASTSVVRAIKL